MGDFNVRHRHGRCRCRLHSTRRRGGSACLGYALHNILHSFCNKYHDKVQTGQLKNGFQNEKQDTIN